jgi:precorrin-3B synthase
MSFAVKGWCPGAHRPMLSGDGYVVRVRPRLARLTTAQAQGLCEAAEAHGAGLIDLTNRANIQIRGVAETAWTGLIADLEHLDLLDPDAATETRRNIVVTPFWTDGDDTQRLANELMARLHDLPSLPPKMGFAIDAGTGPVLGGVSADFRIERGGSGALILRAEGRSTGTPLRPGAEIDTLIRLAHWFVDSSGPEAGRMVRHAAPLPDWANPTEAPAPAHLPLRPGRHPMGAAQGFAFGQVRARDLARALTDSGAAALRVTPWRVALLETGVPGPRNGLLWDADAPELRVDACPGAPFCPQASVETRDLARRLAPHVTGRLHVSGCAKGCARMTAADTVVIGQDGRYALAQNARAGDTPAQTGLSADQILAHFGAA